ncbi:MAG: hypothetical protein AAGE94_01105 [Acidobacteriota bacterium]
MWIGTAHVGPPAEPGTVRRLAIEVRASSDHPQDAALARRLGGVLSSALTERLGGLNPERLRVEEPAEFRLVVALDAGVTSAEASMRLLSTAELAAGRQPLDRWRGSVRTGDDAILVERTIERAARALARELLAGEVVSR